MNHLVEHMNNLFIGNLIKRFNIGNVQNLGKLLLGQFVLLLVHQLKSNHLSRLVENNG